MANANTQVALKEEHIGAVARKVAALQAKHELDIPPNYSIGNALNSAWLELQDVVDKDKNRALDICTKESVNYSLLKMVIQGLSPAKKQCYFIVYGKKLTLMRSYFGTIAVLKRVDPRVADVICEIVYEGDKFAYKLFKGKKIITDHEQTLENVDKAKIRAAYCSIYDHDGEVLETSIMTMAEIKQAWMQSKQHPIDNNGNIKTDSVHDKFTSEMCIKTVVNRACKILINSSDDATIMRAQLDELADEAVPEEMAAEQEIAEKANGDVIDVPVESTAEKVADAEHVCTGEPPDLAPRREPAQAQTQQQPAEQADEGPNW